MPKATHFSILKLGQSHGQRSLADYSPPVLQRVRHDLVTKQQQTQPKEPFKSRELSLAGSGKGSERGLKCERDLTLKWERVTWKRPERVL